MSKCLEYFPGADRTALGYEGLIAAQFNVLKRFREAITPDSYLDFFRKDYRWLAQIYESINSVGGLGSLIESEMISTSWSWMPNRFLN